MATIERRVDALEQAQGMGEPLRIIVRFGGRQDAPVTRMWAGAVEVLRRDDETGNAFKARALALLPASGLLFAD